MNFKKVLFGLASVTLLVVMVACNNNETTTTGDTPTLSTSSTTSIEEPKVFSFESKTLVYRGEEVVLEAKNIPDGYRVEYTNNKGTKKGKYKANCKLYDQNNNLVEDVNAILTIDIEPSKEFDAFCDEFLLEYFSDDASVWNVFTIDSSAFGYVRPADYVPSWYYYEAYTEEDFKEIYEYYKEYKEDLTAFDTSNLSYTQEVSYDVIYSILESGSRYYNADKHFNPLMEIDYIDQFGGYVADFCDTVENYNFYSKQDIIDLIELTKSTDESFATYVTFVKDKYAAGYAYSEFTVKEMCSYLDDIIKDGDDFYLYSLIDNKIKSSTFLSDSEKSTLSTEFSAAIKDDFFVGVNALKTDLSGLVGSYTTSNEGYFVNYGAESKELYKYMLEKRLGYDNINMEEYIATLDEWLKESKSAINRVIATFTKWSNSQSNANNAQEFRRYINGSKFLTSLKTPEDMIAFLKDFAPTIVYELQSNPEIGFKYMDDSVAKRTSTVAYYRKSALDSTSSESITLNGNQLQSNYDEMLLTIAHEGYPGHLYEYVYSKELGLSNIATVASNTGHGEGWAMYVELCLLEYLESSISSKAGQLYCQYSKFNEMYGYYLNARLDAAINYEGWTLNDVILYFSENDLNVEAAEGFYRTLIEMPTVYASYGYGLGLVYHLHRDARTKLGDLYDEKEFNKNFMSHGWCRLEKLEEIAEEYISDVLYINKVSE